MHGAGRPKSHAFHSPEPFFGTNLMFPFRFFCFRRRRRRPSAVPLRSPHGPTHDTAADPACAVLVCSCSTVKTEIEARIARGYDRKSHPGHYDLMVSEEQCTKASRTTGAVPSQARTRTLSDSITPRSRAIPPKCAAWSRAARAKYRPSATSRPTFATCITCSARHPTAARP